MNNNEQQNAIKGKKRKAWLAFMRPTLLLLVTVFLFTYVSFAWLRRDWTPFVEQSGITIATGGSLVFQLEGNYNAQTGMSINEILKLQKDFVLKPVSNLLGRSDTFFTLDLQQGEGSEVYKYLNVADYNNDETQMGIENGYIEFQLMLYSPDADGTTRYVYIHPDSYISVAASTDMLQADVVNCIRVSVSLADGRTWIFGAEGVTTHEGVNIVKSPTNSTQYLMDGVRYYDKYNPEDESKSVVATKYQNNDIVVDYVETQKVGDDGTISNVKEKVQIYSFSDFKGGTYEDGVMVEQDVEKTMFDMVAGQDTKQWVTVRVWAEGTHEDCVDLIAGAKIDLKLKFSSFTETTDS